MIGGDFDAETIGRLLSSAPSFEAARQFRYAPSEQGKAAMIVCASRQQAYDLLRFLEKHRPRRSQPPRLLLGNTPRATREQILDSFERGACDTLIQVGVLIEGWTSPRCKLLIDMAPSVSRVRATQKYFRALTRNGDEEADLFVLLPVDLPSPPVLPMEIFGQSGEYAFGELVRAQRPNAMASRPVHRYEHTPIRGVTLRRRMLVAAALAKPSLQRGDWVTLRMVVATCREFRFEAPPALDRFRWMIFAHKAFAGHGAFLLRWLGFPASRAGFAGFLAAVCPGADGFALLGEQTEVQGIGWCAKDVELLQAAIRGEVGSLDGQTGIVQGERALTGIVDDPVASPCEAVETAELCSWLLLSSITVLSPRYRVALCCRFGLGTWKELTLADSGDMLQRSGTTIAIRVCTASKTLRIRRRVFQDESSPCHPDGTLRTPVETRSLALALMPISNRFLASVVGELSHLELAAGDLDWLDETAARRRRNRQAAVPRDAAMWVEEIARAVQYAEAVQGDEEGDYDLAALLAAVVIRSCLHRCRPKATNEDIHRMLRGIPPTLRIGETDRSLARAVALAFADWYLATHAAFGLIQEKLRDAAWSAVRELVDDIAKYPVSNPWGVKRLNNEQIGQLGQLTKQQELL